MGPPEKEPGPLAKAPVNAEVSSPTTSSTKRIAQSQRIGRYACGWRDGFRAGARDALRQAGRRLPAETWHIVEARADQYELAADD